MALISRAFSERRGRALGINGVFGNMGLAGAPFVTGLLTALLGWRWAYLILALPGLAGALYDAVTPIDEAVGERPSVADGGSRGLPPMRRYFLVLCVAMTLGGLAYR